MAPIEDLYKLQASSEVTIEQGVTEEVDLPTMQLEPAPELAGGVVRGVVYDNDLPPAPIEGATVKLFIEDTGEPFAHVTSASDGSFTFDLVPDGDYLLTASKDGYLMAEAIPVTIDALNPEIDQDITLLVDENATQGTIYGTVTDTNGAVEGAVVTVYDDTTGDLVTRTVTIADGEYVVEDLDPGTYNLMFTSSGHLPAYVEDVVVGASGMVLQSQVLDIDPLAGTGTISGTITDENGDPLTGAFVGLYETDGAGTPETLIAVTYTNDEGRFMFGGVADGTYIVKAKASETV